MQHELLQWPQDKQPKRTSGYITKPKLRKLTVGLTYAFSAQAAAHWTSAVFSFCVLLIQTWSQT